MAPTNRQARAARAKILAGGKSRKARVERYLKSTESKIKENARNALLLKGIRCSQSMGMVLKDLRSVLAPNCKLLSKNNSLVAFGDSSGQQSLEFLTTKNDCSMFCLASTNKKRPNNLVIGRSFDRALLDMVELGIERYKSLCDYSSAAKKRVGSKPMMLFVGDLWEHDEDCVKLKNLLIDLYKGDPVSKLMHSGLDHIIVFTTAGGGDDNNNNDTKPLIHQRTYFCKLKKNPRGGNAPYPLLQPCGPDMDFRMRRIQMAEPDLWKASLQQPQSAPGKSKKIKNQSTNLFGERIGRLHLERQIIDKMGGRKIKALRRADKLEKEADRAAVESELDREKGESNKEFEQTYGYQEE